MSEPAPGPHAQSTTNDGTKPLVTPAKIAAAVALVAVAAASTAGWLARPLPPRSLDIEIEMLGAMKTAAAVSPLLAVAGVLWAAGRRWALYLLPALGGLFFSLGFFFAVGGAGFDDRTGAAAPVQVFYLLSTALGLLLMIAGMAAISPDLARVDLRPRPARLMAVPLTLTAVILASIWGAAIQKILTTGTCSHMYYQAGSYAFFWGMVIHDTAISLVVHLGASALLVARHRLAAPAGFFAASYVIAHFGPGIPIEIQRLAVKGEVDAPLLAASLALVASTLMSAVYLARRAARFQTGRTF